MHACVWIVITLSQVTQCTFALSFESFTATILQVMTIDKKTKESQIYSNNIKPNVYYFHVMAQACVYVTKIFFQVIFLSHQNFLTLTVQTSQILGQASSPCQIIQYYNANHLLTHRKSYWCYISVTNT